MSSLISEQNFVRSTAGFVLSKDLSTIQILFFQVITSFPKEIHKKRSYMGTKNPCALNTPMQHSLKEQN
jgi:hypothetical protein